MMIKSKENAKNNADLIFIVIIVMRDLQLCAILGFMPSYDLQQKFNLILVDNPVMSVFKTYLY